MYQVMIALGGCMLPVYAAVVWGRGLTWTRPFFPVAGAVPLMAALLFKTDTVWHLPPALQSPWFVPHVIAYMLSYAISFVAFILMLVSLFKKQEVDAKKMTKGSYDLLSLAFPLMTFGMLSGALWVCAKTSSWEAQMSK